MIYGVVLTDWKEKIRKLPLRITALPLTLSTNTTERFRSMDNGYGLILLPPYKLTTSDTIKPIFEEYGTQYSRCWIPSSDILQQVPTAGCFVVLIGAAIGLTTPIRLLFNQSTGLAYIPAVEKSIITPVPKVSKPFPETDFRPISIASILCRIYTWKADCMPFLLRFPDSPSAKLH